MIWWFTLAHRSRGQPQLWRAAAHVGRYRPAPQCGRVRVGRLGCEVNQAAGVVANHALSGCDGTPCRSGAERRAQDRAAGSPLSGILERAKPPARAPAGLRTAVALQCGGSDSGRALPPTRSGPGGRCADPAGRGIVLAGTPNLRREHLLIRRGRPSSPRSYGTRCSGGRIIQPNLARINNNPSTGTRQELDHHLRNPWALSPRGHTPLMAVIDMPAYSHAGWYSGHARLRPRLRDWPGGGRVQPVCSRRAARLWLCPRRPSKSPVTPPVRAMIGDIVSMAGAF